MKYLLASIAFLALTIGFTQNEANIWYFGSNAGLDFTLGDPVPLLNGELDTQEGCATISDTTGNLLFYTDGVTVWNSNHQPMLNGMGLNGDSSSTHSAIIVPKPNDSTIYYIFTVDAIESNTNEGLQYSEVDMTLDGGLGGITANKNILLHTPTTEKLTAIQNSATNAFWVVSHKWESDEFIAYNVSTTGVNTTPVVSSIGSYIGGNVISLARGQIKISPDGSQLAVVRSEGLSEVQLFDFDAITGLLSNPITVLDLPVNELVYGVEFSPNSSVLYCSVVGNGVYQYNLQAGNAQDIINSQLLITTLPRPYAAMQLAKNGKIYVAKFNQQIIDVIDNPNVIGLGCNYQFEHLSLNGRFSRSGLPPFIQSFFNIGFQIQNTCEGDATQFTANIPQNYDSLIWDFGDSTTSTLENPSHTYTTAGTYTVSLSVTSGGNTSTDNQSITIYEQPSATSPQDVLICDTNNDGFHNFDLTQNESTILNGQSAATFDVTYYASMADYTAGTAIANPDNYTNATAYTLQTIIASVQNIQNRSCEAITSFDIQVFESPIPNPTIPALRFCDDTSAGTDMDGMILFDLTQNESTILNGQSATDFTVNYYTDAGFTNQILNPSTYQNTNATETIYIQVVNNANTNCTATTAFDIEVYPLPVVNSLVTLRQCDDDLDGFSIFNLTEVNAELSANYLNETINFYETSSDAVAGNNPITNASTYTNQMVSTDTVWARIENTNGCYRTAQVNLVVSTTQIPNSYTKAFYQCDDGTDTTDGIATFDLSSVNAEIQALFPAGQQLLIQYYRNQADALSETNPIADISNYQNIGYPNQQDVFIRVDSVVDNDCLGLGHHITLNVETVPVANSITIPTQCDADGDGMYAFDTTTIETTLLNGQTNVTVSYFDALGSALPSPLPNPFVTASQIITARVTNSTSQDPDGACFDETTIKFTVEAAAVAHPVAAFEVCDDVSNDGTHNFDTSTIETTVLNGQTGMLVSYRDQNGNALPSPLPNPFNTGTQDITVRVQNPLSSTCFDETTISFVVYEQAVAGTVQNSFVCDDASNNGELFTLSDFDTEVLNGQSTSTFEVFYFESDTEAQSAMNPLPNLYQVTTSSQLIFARLQNRNNSDCFDVISFEIGVYRLPIANQPEDISVCDDATNDGEALFNLEQQNTDILNGQSVADHTISYYLSQQDADNRSNTISESFTNTQNPQTVYARLENNANTDCYTTTAFQLIVNEQPVLLMDDQWPICEDDTVEIIADAGYDSYVWSTGATTQSIIVDTAGTYTVTAANIYGNLRCETSKTITVTESNIATITNIETIDWTVNTNVISIFVEGSGDYEYSLDGFIYQDSNVFSNLSADEYTVYVRDKNGCGVTTDEIYLLFYPRFFTPNNDTVNDYWQIYNADREPNNKLFIYDRYGKLLTQIRPTDVGWDGTFNGQRLPTNDYWFVLERQNGQVYRGHFTLKR